MVLQLVASDNMAMSLLLLSLTLHFKFCVYWMSAQAMSSLFGLA